MDEYEMHDVDDLGALWDLEAARLARVLVSEGRLEIVLTIKDEKWVQQALNTLAAKPPIIVLVCPS